MFLEEVLKQSCDLSQPLKILDLCAAPGGKSTLISSFISVDSLLVSNEVIKTRANILAENMTKWGSANVVVTNNDPRDFQKLKGFFDVIVVDAPCSGSGLFRKDPEAISEWSLSSVELCSLRQQRILADVLPSLKQDGVLIYSTCSYSQKEDEEICDWLLRHPETGVESIPLKIDPAWGIVETTSVAGKGYGYRFYPDKLKGEGFFIAAFRKISVEKAMVDNGRKAKTLFASKEEAMLLENYIVDAGRYSFLKLNNELLAIPKSILSEVLQLKDQLYIRKAGVKAGALIRNELLPDHELVLSNIMLPVFPVLEVDESTALDYLRRKEFVIDTTSKGWVIISHLGFALGLIKILPNRINNYYPKEWRIINK
jgi:NOL1/NOP2/fmu family ribosome biogenesis protein